jgi:hypothetical protein
MQSSTSGYALTYFTTPKRPSLAKVPVLLLGYLLPRKRVCLSHRITGFLDFFHRLVF